MTYCSVLEGGTGIASLENAWQALYSDRESPTPFATWEWISAWWNHFSCADPGEPLSLYPIAVYDADKRLIGLAPFYSAQTANGAFRRRALRLVGDLGPEPALSEELPLLLRRGCEVDAIEGLIAYLDGPARNRWDTLHFSVPMASDLQLGSADEHSFTGLRAFSTSTILDVEWLTLPTQWETLRKSLSKSTRDNLGYYPRLLNRHNRNWSIRRVTDSAQIGEASDLLVELHRRRAQCKVSLPHLDHLPSEAHQACVREVFPRLARINMASIWLMEIDGQIEAAQGVLEDYNNICIYYSGFDPMFRNYSPLTILHSEIIQTAILEGKTGVNFLGGSYYYKTRWGTRTVPRALQIRKVRPSPLSLIRTLLHVASRK